MIGNHPIHEAKNFLFDYAIADIKAAVLHMALHPHSMKTYASWLAVLSEMYQSAHSTNVNFDGRDNFIHDQVICKALFANNAENAIRPGAPGALPLAAADNVLRFIPKASARHEIKDPALGAAGADGKQNRDYLNLLGSMRHDTTFIRNILFIATVHRLMRSKMSQALTEFHFPVVTGAPITNKRVTDQAPWETFSDLADRP
jgi:hypothetical protein